MMDYEKISEISVAKILRDFIGDEVLPDIGAGQFWSGIAGLVGAFAPRIRDQLRFRDELQEKIDEYHRVFAAMHLAPIGDLADVGSLRRREAQRGGRPGFGRCPDRPVS
jgi:malate synthase